MDAWPTVQTNARGEHIILHTVQCPPSGRVVLVRDTEHQLVVSEQDVCTVELSGDVFKESTRRWTNDVRVGRG
jgi:hypothetical protein